MAFCNQTVETLIRRRVLWRLLYISGDWDYVAAVERLPALHYRLPALHFQRIPF